MTLWTAAKCATRHENVHEVDFESQADRLNDIPGDIFRVSTHALRNPTMQLTSTGLAVAAAAIRTSTQILTNDHESVQAYS